MKRALCALRNFCRIYINDMIVFFKIFLDHITHLRQLFTRLMKLRVTLNFKKTFLNYSNITLLKQKIDVFEIIITKQRIEIVKALKFSKNLKAFETYLDLANYQRNKIV